MMYKYIISGMGFRARVSGPVHWLRRRIWKRKFYSEDTSNIFRPHYAEWIKKHNKHRSFWICVWLGQGNHAIVSEKPRFQNVFRPHENAKLAFSNFSGLKSVSEKSRFCDGLVWTVGLNVKIKLRFQIPSTQCGRCLRTLHTVYVVVYAVVYFNRTA